MHVTHNDGGQGEPVTHGCELRGPAPSVPSGPPTLPPECPLRRWSEGSAASPGENPGPPALPTPESESVQHAGARTKRAKAWMRGSRRGHSGRSRQDCSGGEVEDDDAIVHLTHACRDLWTLAKPSVITVDVRVERKDGHPDSRADTHSNAQRPTLSRTSEWAWAFGCRQLAQGAPDAQLHAMLTDSWNPQSGAQQRQVLNGRRWLGGSQIDLVLAVWKA
jgi:hypothetical protein